MHDEGYPTNLHRITGESVSSRVANKETKTSKRALLDIL
jgi:hypothetical protein